MSAKKIPYSLAFFLLIFLYSCDKEKSIDKDSLLELQGDKIVKNLQSSYTIVPYFKFSSGEVVENPSGDNWDICFESAQIKINGGNMTQPLRTGNAKGIIINSSYNSIVDIPNRSNLKQDNGKEDYALGYRVGGKSWYYMDDNLFYIPYADKTIFIQSADGKGFVKVQILSYYRDMPNLKGESYKSMETRTGYYTFRYQYIERGQRFQ